MSDSAGSRQITTAIAASQGQPIEITPAVLDTPKANEVLVKMVASGVCHTDVVGRDLGMMSDVMALACQVAGVIEGDAVPQTFIPQLLDYYKKGLFPIDKLVQYYDFADIDQAFADSASGLTVKPVLQF